MSLPALFSDFFARQDNCLARLDPRAKLALASATLGCVLASTHPGLPLAVAVGCVVTTVIVGVPLRQIAARLCPPVAMVGTAILLRWWLDAGSLQSGHTLAARVLGGVSVVLLLSAVTPAHQLFHALREFGAPPGWVELALLMYRYTFTLLETISDVIAAQRVRLGYASIRRGWASAGVVAGTVVLRSVDQAIRTHEAMRVRAYSGAMRFSPLPRLNGRNWVVLAAGIALLLGAYWALEWRVA